MKKTIIESLLHATVQGDKDRVVSILRLASVQENSSGNKAYAITLEGFAAKLERTSPYNRELQALLPNKSVQASLAAFQEIIPTQTLEDILLPSETIQEVRDFLEEHRRREELAAHELEPRNKILLHGPPGNGKTMLAGIIARELGKTFQILRLGGILGSLLGDTIKNLEKAFAGIAGSDSVFLFDEFDALGKARRDDKTDVTEMRRALNTLLKGFENHTGEAIIIAATNLPQDIDPAFRRRFDIIWSPPAPGPSQRAALITKTLTRHKIPTTPKQIQTLADTTEGYSFDECENLAKEIARATILKKTIPTAGSQNRHKIPL